jgi:hypothetical protein
LIKAEQDKHDAISSSTSLGKIQFEKEENKERKKIRKEKK